MTRADYIRSMTDKELVDFLSNIKAEYDITFGDYIDFGNGEVVYSGKTNIKDKLLTWLLSEH